VTSEDSNWSLCSAASKRFSFGPRMHFCIVAKIKIFLSWRMINCKIMWMTKMNSYRLIAVNPQPPSLLQRKSQICTNLISRFAGGWGRRRPCFSHCVAVHSWSVRCNQISQKLINPFILLVQALSKSSMLTRLKRSSLALAMIGSMSIVICNRFHEKLANNDNITTFTGVLLFDALVRRFS